MKKRVSVWMVTLAVIATLFAGCGKGKEVATESSPEAEISNAVEPSEESSILPDTEERSAVRIVAMKGPTGIGMVHLMEENKQEMTENQYEISLEGDPSLVAGKVINGDVDIATVPVNLAATLYNKTEGEVRFLGVNTLGVLYVVSTEENIGSISDLKGKTIGATGQGATPETVFNYLLSQNGMSAETDLTMVYESEGPAVLAKLASGEITTALLPEPFVTTALKKVEGLAVVLDITKEWDAVSEGAPLVTGGVVVRNEFLESHPQEVATFLKEYEASCNSAHTNVEETAKLAVENEILGDEEIAKEAIPRCNITFLQGNEMEQAVNSYLGILVENNPQSIGGTLPDENFYYREA